MKFLLIKLEPDASSREINKLKNWIIADTTNLVLEIDLIEPPMDWLPSCIPHGSKRIWKL